MTFETFKAAIAPIPLWAVFGLLGAFLSSTQMLIQDRLKAPAFPLAFWNKVTCVAVMTPFVFATGLPTNPLFYVLLATQALLWVISDVVFFKGIKEVGAGIVSRVLPMAPLISFFLWFALDPHLIKTYAAMPWRSAGIVGVFCLTAFFAWNLRSCAITKKALKIVWFTLFASVVGTVFTKSITLQADVETGVFGYVFAEALIMIAMWLVFYAVKRPLPAAEMFGLRAIRAGGAVGLVSAFTVAAVLFAYYHVDNPAYVPAVRYLDTVIIFFAYRAMGRPNEGRLWASFGIVACAAALVFLKAHS
ncbi:MAG: hypothetical protein PHS57_01865 [Alphaproteobacteria bacterium]|nr:hypothetical protein [Alphaproteobacteria bacterium]